MIDLEFFKKHKWIGEGNIFVIDDDEKFPVMMKMIIKDDDQYRPILEFSTSIHIDAADDVIENYYTLTTHRHNKFHILIAGENWGHVEGEGFFEENFIGWEVSSADGQFHAYESIKVREEGELLFCGEYAMKDDMTTKVEGVLTNYENVTL